jgi:tRNA threonylcarbamoyladenosine biosynthesis protein TsaB
MALILNIETATSLCSVALAEDDNVLSMRESFEDKSHALKLPIFISEVLKEQKLTMKKMDAVAVGSGPGSYTGLRIGVSTAKGIAYGAKIPLIALSTLETMFNYAINIIKRDKLVVPIDSSVLFCPMIDARRMEVYMALFDYSGKRVENDKAMVINKNSFSEMLTTRSIVFFGNGSLKCREIISHRNAYFIDNVYPSASAMVPLSFRFYKEEKYEDIAYFEPFYLKDFISTTKRKSIFNTLTKPL